MDALVRDENQVRCWRWSIQGPILSVLEGMGRRVWKQILAASERNSTQLLINAHRPVNGQITLNKDTNPNYNRKDQRER